MWLKIEFNEEDIVNWSQNPTKICITLVEAETAPVSTNKTFRLSPIFPLTNVNNDIELDRTELHFFSFPNPYRILGRVEKKGTEQLKNSVYFSLGLCSIIIITSENEIIKEFKEVCKAEETAYEKWEISDSMIVDIYYKINSAPENDTPPFNILSYSSLPLTERSLIDEFNITISLLMSKLQVHMPNELGKILKLIEEVNKLIEEIVFLYNPTSAIPSSLREYTLEQLKDGKLNQLIRHQNLDRIIQINSSLSYISTQAFSGAIPILERRSLIRRNSLLGVGSGILALNNIARFIESSFSKISFDNVITEVMPIAASLSGLDNFPQYSSLEWNLSRIDVLQKNEAQEVPYYKLPYFSGRLGFRETEYSIAAAIQSISCGASLEWSLMTLTHEMLHGHVRNIIGSLFFGGEGKNPDVLRDEFYASFTKRMLKRTERESLSDSIRNVILLYCCYTTSHGSIAVKKELKGNRFEIKLLLQDDLWNRLEDEYRNISEIFVHVLDLHYFYAGRVSIYVPLIWCSWIAVPHINGDIRQYVLRSLLVIASKETGDVFSRYNTSVSRLKDILNKHKSGKLNYPVIFEIIDILNDENKLNDYYFPAFKASLIIVDLVNKVFISEKVRSALLYDDFVKWDSDDSAEDSFEEKFEYDLPDGFNDEQINSPVSYLLDRMISELNAHSPVPDLERESTLQFLALNSRT